MREDEDDDDNQERPGHWRNDHIRFSKKVEQLRRLRFGQRGFLRPQILQLFERAPMNGVDIMNRLQEESHGWYRPSPGSIYPLLEQLEREGLIVKNNEGKYELTSAYAEQSGVGDDVASAISAMESNASYLEDLHRADAARLSKSKDRIGKLAKRLSSLNDAMQSRRET